MRKTILSSISDNNLLRRLLAVSSILFCASCLGLRAQSTSSTTDYLLNRTPGDLAIATPNAASFNKFIDNPVELYSGSTQITIPVYTLKDGDVEFPITLSYATSGIKVSEEASWVGLGWMLNAGGYITRHVIGGIDCYDPQPYFRNVMEAYDKDGTRQQTIHVAGTWSQQMREAMDWFLTEPSRRKTQREGRYNPDVFSYSCPDGSGRFVIDSRNDSIYLLDRREDVKIEVLTDRSSIIGEVIDGFGSRLVGFELTFPNGRTHRFDLLSVMAAHTPAYVGNQSEIYALTQTICPNGQKVDYSYDTSATHDGIAFSEQLRSIIPGTNTRIDGDMGIGDNPARSSTALNLIRCVGKEVTLSCIKTANYEMNFITSGREDLPGVKKLDRIYVKALHTAQPADTCCCDFRFSYDYFVSPNASNYFTKHFSNFSAIRQEAHMLKRLKLNSVCAVADGKEEERYRFFYDTQLLPRKDSYAVDYWGYYNGETLNESFVPDPYYLMWGNLEGYAPIKNLPAENNTILKRSLRAYDFESSKACILTGVQYPTGGYSEITYEPHRFKGEFLPTVSQAKAGGSPTEGQIIYDDNSFFAPDDFYSSPKSFFYTFTKDTSVTLTLSLFRGKNSWSSVAGHRAYISYSKDGALTRMDLSLTKECEKRYLDEEVNHASSSTTTIEKVYEITVKKGSGHIVVDLPDELGDQTAGSGTNARIQMAISYPRDGVEATESESEGAGVRIKQVCFYDSPSKGTLLQHTSYEYTHPDDGTSSGILLNQPRFVEYYRGSYDMLGKSSSTQCDFNEVKVIATRSDKLEISSSNTFPSPYQPMADVGYTYVKEIRHSGKDEGYTLYQYHNDKPLTAAHSVPVFSSLNGSLLECRVYDSAGKLVHKTGFIYEAPVYRYYFGMNFHDRINMFPEVYGMTGWQCMVMSDNTDGPWQYSQCNNNLLRSSMEFSQDAFEGRYVGSVNRLSMVVHPLNFHNILLKRKTVWADGVETSETYSYHPQSLQLKSVRTDRSDGGTEEETYTYPIDCPWGDYAAMTRKHILSPVIERKRFKNGMLIECVLTEHAAVNGSLYLPKAEYRSEITAPLSSSTVTFSSSGRNSTVYPSVNRQFHSYDSFGNPLYLTVGSRTLVYLWSYNGRYPVAEIAGVSYDMVKSALGSITPDALSATAIPDTGLLRGLRIKLPAADIRLYEYRASTGMSGVAFPNGCTVGYEYDPFNRLAKVKDTDGKVTEEYEYHYK